MAQMTHAQSFDIADLGDLLNGDAAIASNATSAVITYQGAFANVTVLGTGFSIPDDKPNKASGTVDEILFFLDGMNVTFSLAGLDLGLKDVLGGFTKGKPDGTFKKALSGDDTFFGSAGNDGFNGQKGEDTVVYEGLFDDFVIDVEKKLVTVFDINSNDGSEGVDTLLGIEYIQFADILYNIAEDAASPLGTSGDDMLTGSDGNDEILGLGGNDIITGGLGQDFLDGGDGDDTLDGGADKDVLVGGAGDDLFILAKGDRAIEDSGGGRDTIQSAGSIKLGDYFEDAVLTGTDNAKIKGNDVANALTGNDGDNKIDGGDGGDTLDGGDGADDLRGQDGADTFVFNAVSAADQDRIRDFEIGLDLIDLSGADVADLDAFLMTAVQDGKSVVFTSMNGARLEIAKTDLNALAADDFIFATSMEM